MIRIGRFAPCGATGILTAFFLYFAFTTIAQACMGIERTITIKSFNAHMGTGGSGGIGLRRGEVVLTFDDGPSPATTPKVLRALENECVKATFFVVGNMARSYPGLLKRVAAAGHTIGQHTQDHTNLQQVSLDAAKRTIISGVNSVNRALGSQKRASTRIFRYPYLSRNARLDAIVRQQGLLPFSATVMSQDWKKSSGAAMVERVMSRLKRHGRGVILLHDIQHKTANALPQLLRRLKRDGYKIVHIRGSSSPRGPKPRRSAPVVASVAKKQSKSTQRSARVSKALAPGQKESVKRRSLLARIFKDDKLKDDKGVPGVDTTITGSVRKSKDKRAKSSLAKRSKKSASATSKRKAKQTTHKTPKAKDAEPGSLKGWIAKRRAKRLAQRKQASLATKPTKRTKASKARKSAKVSKRVRSKKKTSGSKNTKSAKNAKKRRVFFKHRLKRKKGESDSTYHARLRARRITLNKKTAAYSKTN